MKTFPKPVVMVSKCLGFGRCRYDGAMVRDEFMQRLRMRVEFRPVCPEMEIGLSAPRERIRIVRSGEELRLVQPATGRDVTDEMMRFLEKRLNVAQPVHGFIFKSRSPSCGIRDAKVFSAPQAKSPVGKGAGFCAAAAMKKFPALPIEDEERLADAAFREHFLTRLFAAAALDEVARLRSLKAVVAFQSANELLLNAHGAKEAAALNRILANPERRPLDLVLPDYRLRFAQALARPARRSACANVLLCALRHFPDSKPRDNKPAGPGAKEKAAFLASVAEYRSGKVPLRAPRGILHSWIARADDKYLTRQTFFEPYPSSLADQ